MKHTKLFKSLFLLLFSMLLFSCTVSNNDLGREGLRGQIKSISEMSNEVAMRSGQAVSNGYFGYTILHYDTIGNFQSYDYYDVIGSLIQKKVSNRVDENLIEDEFYDGVGNLEYTTVSNISKDLAEFITYDSDGAIIGGGINYYKRNRLIKMDKEDFGNNNAIKETYYSYEYDKKGNLTSVMITDSNGETVTWIYDYTSFDEMDNWTQCLHYYSNHEDGKEPLMISRRQYEYYDYE